MAPATCIYKRKSATVIWSAPDADMASVDRFVPSAFDPEEYVSVFEPWRIEEILIETVDQP